MKLGQFICCSGICCLIGISVKVLPPIKFNLLNVEASHDLLSQCLKNLCCSYNNLLIGKLMMDFHLGLKLFGFFSPSS